jgi:hypothetical protein
MKKHLIALAVSTLVAIPAFATQPGANVIGGGLVGSQVGGVATSLNGGSSQSGASNQQSATVSVTTQTAINTQGVSQNGVKTSTATTSATGSTVSSGFAYNISSGAGAWGGAASQGIAAQGAVGIESVHDVGSGDGVEASGTVDSIVAGVNQGSAFEAYTGGNYTSTVGVVESHSTSGSSNNPSNPKTDTSTATFTANTSGSTYANTTNYNGVYTTPVYNGGVQTGESIGFGNSVPVGSAQVSQGAGTGDIVNAAGGVFGAQAEAGGVVSSQQGNPSLNEGPLSGGLFPNSGTVY